MRWAGHVKRMEKRGVYKVFVLKPEGKTPLGKPSVDGRVILRLFFRKYEGVRDWLDLVQDRDRLRALLIAKMKLRFL
jgi:hypothetical protein